MRERETTQGEGINGLEPSVSIRVTWPVPFSYGYAISAYEMVVDGGAPERLSGDDPPNATWKRPTL